MAKKAAPLSRSGRPTTMHVLGKCSEDRIDIPVPSRMKEQIAALATMQGMSVADWCRKYLTEALIVSWFNMRGTLPPGISVGEGNNVHQIR